MLDGLREIADGGTQSVQTAYRGAVSRIDA